MKKIILFLLFLISLSMAAQKTIIQNFKLPNGTSKDVKIFIPKNYDTDTIFKYPVIIVLNDGYLFDLVKGNVRLFANADLAPKQIVVGVPTDLRKNRDVSIVRQSSGLSKNAKVYYSFIKDNLMKYIKGTYRTSPFSTIVSNGKAATFSTYFLKEAQPPFNSFVCLNAKITEKFNRLIHSYDLSRFGNIKNSYFFYANSHPFQSKKKLAAYKQLKEGLGGLEIENFNFKFDSFEDALNVKQAVSEGIPRALSQIFSLYRNISKKEFNENIKDLDPMSAIEYLENKYIDIDYLYGTNTNVRLEDFYAIEGIVTDQDNGDFLRVLGDFALIKHPESPLGDYYMGRFYEIGKEYIMADSYYKTGYGKIDPSDPSGDGFYKNIERITKLIANMPKEEPKEVPPEEEVPEETPEEE